MFCSKCGNNLSDGTLFCPNCGNKVGEVNSSATKKEVKVILDPAEVVPQKAITDSSKTFSGQWNTIGLSLMTISIIGDLLSMFVIGFDFFIPITIGASILFVIGFFMQMFSS